MLLAGRGTHEVSVQGWGHFFSLRWAAHGRGLFVGASDLAAPPQELYMDLEARAEALPQ